ncbi:MAG: pirin family protein [Myxococcaceae bacterium]|nr:pirin family protein [Myxococcaceae bacterium]
MKTERDTTPSAAAVPAPLPSRTVRRLVQAHRQLEGAGFVVRRPVPTVGLEQVEPFLMLDEMGPVTFGPGEAVGAPDHPHRGFETVTYVLEGEAQHEDSAGHRGTIGPGDVQWMTAGAGIVHSEEPSDALKRDGGRMHGFQLWVNLPRRDKLMAPRYQELKAAQIPRATSADGLAKVVVIAGEALGVSARIETRTPILYQHWSLAPGARVSQPIDASFNGFVYVFRGAALVGDREVKDGQLAILSDGGAIELSSAAGAELLLLAGQPLKEPLARYGPFVMNTQQELVDAFRDFEAGRLGAIAR